VESTTYIFGYNWTNAIPIGAGSYTYNNNLYIIPEDVVFQVGNITETTSKLGDWIYLTKVDALNDVNTFYQFQAVPITSYNLRLSVYDVQNQFIVNNKWLQLCLIDNQTQNSLGCSYLPHEILQPTTTSFTQTVTAPPPTPPPYTFTLTPPQTNPFLSNVGLTTGRCTDISSSYEYVGSYYYYQTNDIVIYLNYTSQVVIYPNARAYGKYQIACSSLFYCGFRNYVYIYYDKNYQDINVMVVYPQDPTKTVQYASVVGKYAIVSLTSRKIEDFPGVGSLIAWELEVNGETGAHYKTTVWSVVTASSETIPQPYPLDVYGTTKLKIYDCGQTGLSSLCPSNNPVFCALWSFFTWLANTLYKILPAPIQAIFNYLSTFFSIVVSALSIMFNPTLVYLVLVSFTTLLVFYVVGEALDKGVIGVTQAFFNIFDLLKRIVEFIINLIKSIIPF